MISSAKMPDGSVVAVTLNYPRIGEDLVTLEGTSAYASVDAEGGLLDVMDSSGKVLGVYRVRGDIDTGDWFIHLRSTNEHVARAGTRLLAVGTLLQTYGESK